MKNNRKHYEPKMNAKIYFRMSSEFHNKLKSEAIDASSTISEICRERIREGPRFDRIEFMLKIIIGKIFSKEECEKINIILN